jgi:hypothetical protein
VPSWRPSRRCPWSEALYRHHTGRSEPPTKPARYAELVVGRRGGKSRILALIATYLACVLDHRPYIVPGEVPVVAIIAKDRTQARVILSYVAGFLRAIPLFAELIEDELAESIRLSNGVVVEVHTASIGAPRGRTFLAVLCDELAFWVTGEGANPDVEVLNAVRPGLSTIPHSLLLIASSPYAKRGVLYANYAKYFGKDSAPVLVWQGATEEMNSSLVGDALIAEMYADDPERASSEFGARFRSDIVAFVAREAVEACVDDGVYERAPLASVSYVGFLDPSGGSADSMTMSIGHREGEQIIIDVVRERRPPFSPEDVSREFASLFRAYRATKIQSDKYAGLWPAEMFRKFGVECEQSARPKTELYLDLLPAINSGSLRLLDIPRLVSQLCGLERRTARSGRDSIAEPQGSFDARGQFCRWRGRDAVLAKPGNECH